MAKPHIRHNTSKALINDKSTLVFTSAIFCTSTFAPALAFVLGLPGIYINKNL